ncbi:glycoside hydrolase family 68 protein [Halomicrobium salinisoli]|uniref:glycoside hydrolase family 68 protein n=1 Tax=Halomicrobium salinisoli TaxID=2878391 RepID=UPI001CEFD327|nr:glycoside hydrolase family 68 protein [Halomicrobium salinisoli]
MDSADRHASGYRARSGWSRDHAAALERTDDAVAPVFYPPESDPAEDVHVWDTWLLRDRRGRIAEVDGYRVAFHLTAPADLLPGKRHDVATIRYSYSPDGHSWEMGEPVFESPLGQRQWAGSALYDDGDLYVFYTAAGRAGDEDLTYDQRVVGAGGGRVETGDDGLAVTGPWEHQVLVEPDGERYEREDQSRGMTYTFRDPWFYEDPETGTTHLLFEANVPVPEGSDACGGDADQQAFNGCVGLAESPSGDPLEWELREPILDAVCVNQELERPHVLRRDGRYYLFVSSHRHTFAPGLDGFDALYGFVADSLRGDYEPLNGSGLVVTNPENAPYQSYSWMVLPHGDEALVQSFFNYYDFAAPSMDAVADLPDAEQRRRFGGTMAPTLRLGIDGPTARIRGKLDHWRVPLPREDLPPLESELFEASADRGRGRYGGRSWPT